MTNSAPQLSAEIESNSIGELTNLGSNEVVAHYDTEQLLYNIFNQENCHHVIQLNAIGDNAAFLYMHNFASV